MNETEPNARGTGNQTNEADPAGGGVETTKGESEERTRDEWVDYSFSGDAVLSVENLDVHYGDDHALKDIK
ncbi:MAG: phosphate ABC transporter ATP-binding protein, partial [Halobacteria archaeon]